MNLLSSLVNYLISRWILLIGLLDEFYEQLLDYVDELKDRYD